MADDDELDRMEDYERFVKKYADTLVERDEALDRARLLDSDADHWHGRTEKAEAERDALAARLAAAEKVVEAAKAWRDAWHATLADPTQTGVSLRVRGMELLAAVDAYRTHEPEPEQT